MVPEGQGPPLAIEISQTIISVAWQAPTRGNGPNVRFELSRMKLRQPLEGKIIYIDFVK
jgi:usherin